MNAERWQQIEDLFQSALEHEPEERSDFLAEACGGDVSLCLEVESLIASYAQDEGFIETPACEFAAPLFADQPVELPVGYSIGPYRVLASLGVGGMGDVYLAEDTLLGRKVALKLLPACFVDDRDHLRRFEQEARAWYHPRAGGTRDRGGGRRVRTLRIHRVECSPHVGACDVHPLYHCAPWERAAAWIRTSCHFSRWATSGLQRHLP